MKYFIEPGEMRSVSPVLHAVQIMSDGNVVSFRVNEFDREKFCETFIGVGVRSHKVGKYTVLFSIRAKSAGKPMNYLASRFTRLKIYGDAFVIGGMILGVPLLFDASEVKECSDTLDNVFVRKRRQ